MPTFQLLFDDGHFLNENFFKRVITRIAGNSNDLIRNIHSFNYFSKNGILPV